jgi:hypothetical protein
MTLYNALVAKRDADNLVQAREARGRQAPEDVSRVFPRLESAHQVTDPIAITCLSWVFGITIVSIESAREADHMD